jgi:hypothetical protein
MEHSVVASLVRGDAREGLSFDASDRSGSPPVQSGPIRSIAGGDPVRKADVSQSPGAGGVRYSRATMGVVARPSLEFLGRDSEHFVR